MLVFSGQSCSYTREDLELLQEMVACEIIIVRKKLFFVALYRSPSQNSEEFQNRLCKLQLMVNKINGERPLAVILTDDFNCRSTEGLEKDVQNPKGSAFEEFIDTNNLVQQIDEPTNVRATGMSYLDLTITDQPNLFVDSWVIPPWIGTVSTR